MWFLNSRRKESILVLHRVRHYHQSSSKAVSEANTDNWGAWKLLHLRLLFKASLYLSFRRSCLHEHSFSSPYMACLGMRLSVHSYNIWAFSIINSMLVESVLSNTSWLLTHYCTETCCGIALSVWCTGGIESMSHEHISQIFSFNDCGIPFCCRTFKSNAWLAFWILEVICLFSDRSAEIVLHRYLKLSKHFSWAPPIIGDGWLGPNCVQGWAWHEIKSMVWMLKPAK